MRRSLVGLLKALRAAMWRQSVYPERLKVERLDGGRVRLVLELEADEVIDDEPRRDGDPDARRRSTP